MPFALTCVSECMYIILYDHCCTPPNSKHPSCSKEDVEAKYYADGEDAFAMRRDLNTLAEQVERERQSQRRKALPAPPPTDTSTVT